MFETIMNGRFRRATMRRQRRIGRNSRVKRAEARRACGERGGRPKLGGGGGELASSIIESRGEWAYRTRSRSVNGFSGFAARRAISSVEAM